MVRDRFGIVGSSCHGPRHQCHPWWFDCCTHPLWWWWAATVARNHRRSVTSSPQSVPRVACAAGIRHRRDWCKWVFWVTWDDAVVVADVWDDDYYYYYYSWYFPWWHIPGLGYAAARSDVVTGSDLLDVSNDDDIDISQFRHISTHHHLPSSSSSREYDSYWDLRHSR